ncbi:hypothetical protein C6568_12015 [Melaminivora suipulveris]|uniref:Uncharacterized protein n=1 Tax=Melaminivora suipulveris TaxID=2109913 RepID=A0A2R3QDP0_9BURK|nr:hypothetical protein [Melaminivora suipulveris]AVO49896.1 hypothetical protein C6568_12015 [Melaminivora suipulveris]
MQRCPTCRPRLRPPSFLPALALCAALLSAFAPSAAHAQAALQAGQRNFPASAERGKLVLFDRNQAELDGRPVRLAPGLRIFNERNALVFAHTLAQRPLTVNYVREASTGFVHTVWLLTPAELEQKRPATPRTRDMQ